MRIFPRHGIALALTALSLASGVALAQPGMPPTNDAPDPYTTITGWAKMPEGRTWGSTSAVDIDKDGKSIWVAERCGQNSCLGSDLAIVLKFDPTGKMVKSFGAGLMIFPHGIYVDKDGNIWVTDGRDNLPRPPRPPQPGDPPPPPPEPMPAKLIGHQVFEFSPEGKVLMALGKPGGNQPGKPAEKDSFYQPNDVITNDKGEIFVAEGHGGDNGRIVKFDKDGKYIEEWGKKGSAPGEFNQPHGLAFDSKGRLFVADRSNNRIQIFDQEGNFLEEWYQYSRLSGIWIDSQDVLYGTDSESGSVAKDRPQWKRGIRIGNVKDGKNGKLTYFIPDPDVNPPSTSAAEGIAVDKDGVIYGAEVGPKRLQRYVRK
jgi:NHL repeat